MQLYKISNTGELVELSKLAFYEDDVYLVDDEEKNTIFIWVGLQVPQSTKDITAEIARKKDKERGGSTKILIMKQKREYGSFLAMMHNLEKGLIPGKTIERRPEFVLEYCCNLLFHSRNYISSFRNLNCLIIKILFFLFLYIYKKPNLCEVFLLTFPIISFFKS